MNYILILYPKLFNSYSKFSRKIEKIISRLDNVNFLTQSDPNNFIYNFSKDRDIKVLNFDDNQDLITHAIIFDDGEEFLNETVGLKSMQIPLRVVKIAITRVINIKTDIRFQISTNNQDYEYIGRGSYWGNPYSMYENGDDRDEVIRKFKYDFDYEKFPNKDKEKVYLLAGKRLGCFCKPLACHGDILANFLNSWDDGK
ncbi:DUF4326 domain-containing protein [Pasteurella atlantica]|uniref:DUF4326 domain-containing protein n=1 Tax=Pasteurellaceae TaxID=712 RepID=UPI00276AE8D5|nr:DUF4326 domain-containing protein [Pasteurella atlantica]MDP8033842.1 DUF4326 domain-containing protein [Pasteurella atlantica]MDP8035777.1 DUF4326 domain-containing protein [Pasteurella atlantica]MDP8037688.1 DUF4326 domain-containing protein [Pasteurella atlantica]MDP8048078.1 DUF4326 domain-containing protein [Pasteurella atlantica]MDP8050101.1 DUF4326 domain-containing protein [Pasteurella atlantica]